MRVLGFLKNFGLPLAVVFPNQYQPYLTVHDYVPIVLPGIGPQATLRILLCPATRKILGNCRMGSRKFGC